LQIIDAQNYEFGLTDILTPKMARIVSEIPEDALAMSEQELIQAGSINELDWKLRIKFWQEFRKVMDPQIRGNRVPKINVTNVHSGICEHTTLSKKLTCPYKAAFIFRPISDFEEETEMVLQLGAKRLWEIMTMDISGKDGKVDPRRAGILLSAIGLAADRSRGLAVMRSQSVNVNLSKEDSEGKKIINQMSDPDLLEKRIKELESQLGNNVVYLEGETIEGDS
jgi:hypothetical protein